MLGGTGVTSHFCYPVPKGNLNWGYSLGSVVYILCGLLSFLCIVQLLLALLVQGCLVGIFLLSVALIYVSEHEYVTPLITNWLMSVVNAKII